LPKRCLIKGWPKMNTGVLPEGQMQGLAF
jgi:hypothetical protein